jgi:hypothetical protein
VDFAIDLLLSDAPGNELSRLGAEIENENHLAWVHGFGFLG